MVDGLQYHLTDLYEYTEYTFWVSAFNANGEGILSEEIAARWKIHIFYCRNILMLSSRLLSSVTKLGDLLDLGQLFKAFGNN